jgi:CSLREA domain-containing protein
MRARRLTLILPLLLVLLTAAAGNYAPTLTVTKIKDTNDGVCDADCSLREAVVIAAPGDTIVFSALFNSPQTITLTKGQISIDKALMINGTGTGLLSVSGNNAGRIFYISSGAKVTMTGMKLRDGWVGANRGDAIGGAINCLDSSLNLANVEFTNNTALYTPETYGYGGAIFSYNCTLTGNNLSLHHNIAAGDALDAVDSPLQLNNSVINDNSCGGVSAETLNVGSSIFTRNTGVGASGHHITVVDSRVIGNGSGIVGGDAATTMMIASSIISENGSFQSNSFTGGITNVGTATIRDCAITNNTRNGWGGGIANGGNMYLINSSVTDNRSLQGGGIHTTVGQLFLTNSTVSGNVVLGNASEGVGGGIYNATTGSPGSRVTLINSTVVNNSSTGKGGGIRQDTTGNVTVRNSIIAQNISTATNEEDVSGPVVSEGINLIGNTVGSIGWIAVDLLNVNPNLGPLGNNGSNTFTHALLPGSPAINAGNNSLAVDPLTMQPLTQDQRGRSRFVGGTNQTVDIGAYEALYSQSPVTVSGRITTYSGRGIDRTRINIDDGQGNVFYTQTNPFGYYRLINLIPGTTYAITVTHKLYLFTSPQFFTADQNRDDLNFITGYRPGSLASRASRDLVLILWRIIWIDEVIGE